MRWHVWVAGGFRGARETYGAAQCLRDHYLKQEYGVDKVTDGVLHETDWKLVDHRANHTTWPER